jgi:hypothetical protein
MNLYDLGQPDGSVLILDAIKTELILRAPA